MNLLKTFYKNLFGNYKDLLTVFLIFFSLSTYSHLSLAEDFKQCTTKDASRSELDHFCPRLEGIHPKGCCPPLQKEPPLKCSYAIYDSRGQPKLVNSTYTSCENGSDVEHTCCMEIQVGCYKDRIDLDFIPRLLYRSDDCCFENCPGADYWRAAPPKGGLSEKHERITTSGPECKKELIQSCSVGTSANCAPSDPCPVPAPAPGPAPAPPAPAPPAPAPAPPAPAPAPPAPAPAPEPAPQPQPEPEPAPPPEIPPEGG